MNTNIFAYITMKRFIAGVKKRKSVFYESLGIFEVSVVKYREVGGKPVIPARTSFLLHNFSGEDHFV